MTLLAPCCRLPTPAERERRKAMKHTRLQRRDNFVGLVNLGNTCYANSLVQQFFMIPSLRYSLLSADTSPMPAETEQPASPGIQGDSTASATNDLQQPQQEKKFVVLPEVQHMLCQLQVPLQFEQVILTGTNFFQESKRQAYDPLSFIKSLSSNLDIGQQQDADEFFNVFTDRIEREVAGTQTLQALNYIFKGTPKR